MVSPAYSPLIAGDLWSWGQELLCVWNISALSPIGQWGPCLQPVFPVSSDPLSLTFCNIHSNQSTPRRQPPHLMVFPRQAVTRQAYLQWELAVLFHLLCFSRLLFVAAHLAPPFLFGFVLFQTAIWGGEGFLKHAMKSRSRKGQVGQFGYIQVKRVNPRKDTLNKVKRQEWRPCSARPPTLRSGPLVASHLSQQWLWWCPLYCGFTSRSCRSLSQLQSGSRWAPPPPAWHQKGTMLTSFHLASSHYVGTLSSHIINRRVTAVQSDISRARETTVT